MFFSALLVLSVLSGVIVVRKEPNMNSDEIVAYFRSLSKPENIAGQARFGINPSKALGVSMPVVRALARQAGHDHALAQALWDTGYNEVRILAAFVDKPAWVDDAQMERWVADFDSWDVCDQVCSNLFDRTPYAVQKALEWSRRPGEFVKRAGFVLMAAMAVHDKFAPDSLFSSFLPIITQEAVDERNFVRKAVNWALRQIGKRSPSLCLQALDTAENLCQSPSSAARWVGKDAYKELLAHRC